MCSRTALLARSASIVIEASARPARRRAEHGVGVGDGRLVSAKTVGGRTRLRTGASWTDRQKASRIDRCDAPASSAQSDDIEHGDSDRVALDLTFVAHLRVAVPNQADVEAGSAHVHGHRVRTARGLREATRSDEARRRPGENRVDALRRAGGRYGHQSAVGLHDHG